MLNDKICELRDKLNKSLIDGTEYEEIYKICVELDGLIAEYYGWNTKQKVNLAN